MSRDREDAAGLNAEERQALSRLAWRLERERPPPSAAFRDELRRRLIHPRRADRLAARYRVLAASYAGCGLLLLAVAAAGLAGGGPFAVG